MSNSEAPVDFADWVRCIRSDPRIGRAQSVHRIVDPFAGAGAFAEGGPGHAADR